MRLFSDQSDMDSLTPAQHLEELISKQPLAERVSAEIRLTVAAVRDVISDELRALLENAFWQLPDAQLYMDIANNLGANKPVVPPKSRLDLVKATLMAKYKAKSA